MGREDMLLAVLDAADAPRSTYDLTIAVCQYPPDTDLRLMGPGDIAQVRLALRQLAYEGHVEHVGPPAKQEGRGLERRAHWQRELWICSRGRRALLVDRAAALIPPATLP